MNPNFVPGGRGHVPGEALHRACWQSIGPDAAFIDEYCKNRSFMIMSFTFKPASVHPLPTEIAAASARQRRTLLWDTGSTQRRMADGPDAASGETCRIIEFSHAPGVPSSTYAVATRGDEPISAERLAEVDARFQQAMDLMMNFQMIGDPETRTEILVFVRSLATTGVNGDRAQNALE